PMHRPRTRVITAITATAAALALALTGCGPATSSSSADDRPIRIWSGSTTPINNNFSPFAVDTATHLTYGAIYEPLFFFNQLSADAPQGMIGESYSFNE